MIVPTNSLHHGSRYHSSYAVYSKKLEKIISIALKLLLIRISFHFNPKMFSHSFSVGLLISGITKLGLVSNKIKGLLNIIFQTTYPLDTLQNVVFLTALYPRWLKATPYIGGICAGLIIGKFCD